MAREAIASALDAFLETVEHIEDCYKEIEAKPATNQAQFYKLVQKARGYPYKASYHYEGRKVTNTYNARLIDETKHIFSANFGKNRVEGGQVIVKFTHQYPEDVHRLLEEHRAAPKLRECCGLPGGWLAVFIDKSRYKPLCDISLLLSHTQEDRVKDAVRKTVELLHGANFVSMVTYVTQTSSSISKATT